MTDPTPDGPRASAQDLLGGAGAPPSVSFQGRTYPLCPDQAAAARYEELVANWAIDNVLRLKGKVPDAAYAPLWDRLQEQVAGRQYGRGGVLWRTAMDSPDGDSLFLAALLGTDVATARAAAAADPDRVQLALVRAIPPFLGQLLTGLPGLTPDVIAGRVAAAEQAMASRVAPGSSAA